MHRRSIAYGALAALTGLAIIAMVPAISRAQQDEPNRADLPPQPFAPQLSALMNLLIQPRHAKLGLAGRTGNWPLATYALVEIRQVFAGIKKAQPRFAGLPVAELVEAAIGQPLNAVEAAIKQQDAKKFAVAYDQLTQGCNACHQAVDHPFVVIKVPDASAFPNQDFSPRP